MTIDIIGISGSPIPNSNTDRIIQDILGKTEAGAEFVKLSDINVRPCLGCKKCITDNICKVKDDFPELAEKIKNAKGLIIGGYIPYSQIDGFTKALLERFWSLRHQKNLLKGKLAATVLTGCMPEALDSVNQSLADEMTTYENMALVGQITVQGNLPCAFCGLGDTCEMSGINMIVGPEGKASEIEYSRAENQKDVQEKVLEIATLLRKRLN